MTLALMAYLGQYAWRRRHISGARMFVAACIVCLPWILGVIMQISAVAVSTQIFWYQFQAVWLLPVAATITCFILQFAGLDSWLHRRTYALLFLVPVLNALTIVTNPFHHFMWSGFELSGHVEPLQGPLYWLFNSYVYLLGTINLAVLVWLAIRSPGHRWPVAIIVAGQLIARVAFTLDKMNIGWFGPGEMAFFTVGIVATSYAIAFLGFHVIEPVAAARTSVLEQMREGMLVLDSNDCVLDVNPMAASILGVPAAGVLGRPVSAVLPFDSGAMGGTGETPADQTEILLGSPDSPRLYDINRTPLKDRSGEVIGQLLLLHDITEQHKAQARIMEQQEVVMTLRERERISRELHDGIGQTLGYVGLQAEAALKWVRGGNMDKAESILRRLTNVAREAHADVRESILNLKADALTGWSFIPTLRTYLEKYQANFGIRIRLEISDDIAEDAFEPAAGVQLMRIVQEALSNSRRHGGARNVEVSVGINETHAHVIITDDGKGFDGSRAVDADGVHFGLAFMRERMQQIGGALTIDSQPGAGTVLTLGVPTSGHGRNDDACFTG